MSAELLTHLQAFRQGVITTHHLNDFLAENGPQPMGVYGQDGKTKLYDTQVDWTLLRMVKGLVFGLYMEMWNDKVKSIGNQILLEEGSPQYIKEDQKKFLNDIDQRFNLTPALTRADERRMIVISDS